MNITCTTYTYTGDDQVIITAPPDAAGMTVKLWGGGGSRERRGKADTEFTAGCGGYTSAQFDGLVVRPGDVLTVVVARGGFMWFRNGEVRPVASGPGFGGVGDDDSGGGLSGVFTGGDPVLATQRARALAVAGGGGSYGREWGGLGSEGGNGNSNTSGGENTTMEGSSDAVLDGGNLVDVNRNPCNRGRRSASSSGGGGYEGGGRIPSVNAVYDNDDPNSCGYEVAAARGGSGYVDPRAVPGTDVIEGTVDGPSGLPPNTNDTDYVDGVGVKGTDRDGNGFDGGHGLAVVCWIPQTPEPTSTPTEEPTPEPTSTPTEQPTAQPTEEPTEKPTVTATPTAESTTSPLSSGSPESTCPVEANANRTRCCPITEGASEYGEDCAVLSCKENYDWNAQHDGCVVKASAKESDPTLALVLSILGLVLLCSSLIAAVVYAVKACRSAPPSAKTVLIQPMVNRPEEPVEDQLLDRNADGTRYSNGASRRWMTEAGVGGSTGFQSPSPRTQAVVFRTQHVETHARTAHHRMLHGSSYNPRPVLVPM